MGELTLAAKCRSRARSFQKQTCKTDTMKLLNPLNLVLLCIFASCVKESLTDDFLEDDDEGASAETMTDDQKGIEIRGFGEFRVQINTLEEAEECTTEKYCNEAFMKTVCKPKQNLKNPSCIVDRHISGGDRDKLGKGKVKGHCTVHYKDCEESEESTEES